MIKHGLWVCLLAMAISAPTLAQDRRERQDDPAKPEAAGQDKPAGEAGGAMNAEMMAWMEAGTPNENHEHLKAMAGQWTAQVKWWEPGMEEPMTSQGRHKAEMVLGGRYLASEYEGDMMGAPFQGMGIMGYDNVKKKYFSGWVDSMSTGVYMEYGDYDKGTKTFTLSGEMDSPTGKKVKSKSEIKIVSNDKQVHTMYHSEDGGPMRKAMEITFERAGGTGAASGAGG